MRIPPVAVSLDALMDAVRPDDSLDQHLQVRDFERFLGTRTNLRDRFIEELPLDNAMSLFSILCDRYGNLPPATWGEDEEIRNKGYGAGYKAGQTLVALPPSSLSLKRYGVIHEFCHHWIASHFIFAFSNQGQYSTPLLDHGGIFVAAYLSLLSQELGFSLDFLHERARMHNLHIAPLDVFGLAQHWLTVDLSVDGQEQREMIEAIAKFDMPISELAKIIKPSTLATTTEATPQN